MDLSALTAEIEKKRKLLEDNDLVVSILNHCNISLSAYSLIVSLSFQNEKRKYFKLSELYSKTQEDVKTSDNKNDNDDQVAQSSSNGNYLIS